MESSLCLIYSNSEESTNHVFWDCPAAHDVKNQACTKLQKISIRITSFTDLWMYLYDKLDHMELSEDAIIMKKIWQRRNDVIHSKVFTHPNLVIQGAKILIASFIDAYFA